MNLCFFLVGSFFLVGAFGACPFLCDCRTEGFSLVGDCRGEASTEQLQSVEFLSCPRILSDELKQVRAPPLASKNIFSSKIKLRDLCCCHAFDTRRINCTDSCSTGVKERCLSSSVVKKVKEYFISLYSCFCVQECQCCKSAVNFVKEKQEKKEDGRSILEIIGIVWIFGLCCALLFIILYFCVRRYVLKGRYSVTEDAIVV